MLNGYVIPTVEKINARCVKALGHEIRRGSVRVDIKEVPYRLIFSLMSELLPSQPASHLIVSYRGNVWLNIEGECVTIFYFFLSWPGYFS